MNYSLIIPIYNELPSLPLLFKKLDKLKNHIEIIIIDDGSDDGTKEFLNINNQFFVLRNALNLGKGASIKKGVKAASKKNIILMDGDLEIEIDQIPSLIKKYEGDEVGALIGKRWEKNQTLKLNINLIGNFLINSLFNIFFNSDFNDVLCCVKILSKKDFSAFKIKSNDFSIEIETMAMLVKSDLNIIEKSVKYNRRTVDQGKKLKVTDGWDIILTMLRVRYF